MPNEIKPKYSVKAEITNENALHHQHLNVAAYHYCVLGGCGNPGLMFAITWEGEIYTAQKESYDGLDCLSKENLELIVPAWVLAPIEGDRTNAPGWLRGYDYTNSFDAHRIGCGLGNYWFMCKEVWELFKTRFDNEECHEPGYLNRHGLSIIMDIISSRSEETE